MEQSTRRRLYSQTSKENYTKIKKRILSDNEKPREVFKDIQNNIITSNELSQKKSVASKYTGAIPKLKTKEPNIKIKTPKQPRPKKIVKNKNSATKKIIMEEKRSKTYDFEDSFMEKLCNPDASWIYTCTNNDEACQDFLNHQFVTKKRPESSESHDSYIENMCQLNASWVKKCDEIKNKPDLQFKIKSASTMLLRFETNNFEQKIKSRKRKYETSEKAKKRPSKVQRKLNFNNTNRSSSYIDSINYETKNVQDVESTSNSNITGIQVLNYTQIENSVLGINYFVKESSLAYCYIEDIIKYYLEVEEANYLVLDHKIADHRSIVINWLIKLHDEYDTNLETLYSAIILFDKALLKMGVSLSWQFMQLAGLACFYILCKLQEQDTSEELLFNLANEIGFNKSLIKKMEQEILAAVEFKLLSPEPSIFVIHYLRKIEFRYLKMLLHTTFYLIECFFTFADCLVYKPSEIAAGAIYLATTLIVPESEAWSSLKNQLGYYEYDEVKTVVNDILKSWKKIHEKNNGQKYPFIKYSSSKYDSISTLLSLKI